MKLIFIRHGETLWTREMRYQGRSDIPLTEKGKRQGVLISKYLQKLKPTHIYSSPLKRAYETALTISEGCKLKPIIIDERISEISFGKWEGLTPADVESRYPAEFKLWLEQGTVFTPPQAENKRSFEKRVVSFLKELLKDYSRQTPSPILAIVCHGGPIRIALLTVLKTPIQSFQLLKLDPASISIIEGDEKFPYISLVNSTSHLEENE
jgi:broad specificity phosphatase PhoE